MSDFGSTLKELRHKRMLTQDELAHELEKLGCSASSKCTISQYENGKRLPEVKTLIIIAKFFNVSVDYLLGEEKENNEHNERFINLLGMLDEKETLMVEAYMTALIDKSKIF